MANFDCSGPDRLQGSTDLRSIANHAGGTLITYQQIVGRHALTQIALIFAGNESFLKKRAHWQGWKNPIHTRPQHLGRAHGCSQLGMYTNIVIPFWYFLSTFGCD